MKLRATINHCFPGSRNVHVLINTPTNNQMGNRMCL